MIWARQPKITKGVILYSREILDKTLVMIDPEHALALELHVCSKWPQVFYKHRHRPGHFPRRGSRQPGLGR